MPQAVGTLRLPVMPAAPGSPQTGETYYDSGTNYTYYWNGTRWVISPTLEVYTGPTAPAPRGDYTIWIDTSVP